MYTMFISNNRTSFHFWLKTTLLKHQKVSKYESGCSFEGWEIGEQRTLEQKKNMRNIN